MAVTITQKPNQVTAANSPMAFVLSESSGVIYDGYKFRYILQVFIDGTERAKLKLHKNNSDDVVIDISKIVKNGVVVDFVKQNKKITQRQQLDKIYFPYGVVYMSKIKSYLKYETFYQDKTLPYFIKRWQNYEIDDIYDFLCIETIMKNECF